MRLPVALALLAAGALVAPPASADDACPDTGHLDATWIGLGAGSEEFLLSRLHVSDPLALTNFQKFWFGLPKGDVHPFDLEGFGWQDYDYDGYIGFGGAKASAYQAGLICSPNDYCPLSAGLPCETTPLPDELEGKAVRVAPPPGGWPPGALVLRDWKGLGTVETSTPAGGTNVVDLRVAATCSASNVLCETRDAIYLPAGTVLAGAVAEAGTPSGVLASGAFPSFAPGITLTWPGHGAASFLPTAHP